MEDFLSDLNTHQRRAVLHSGSPLLVLAGPGSGKTRVVSHRIAYQTRNRGIPEERLLAITFTNRAAVEMRLRVDELLEHPGQTRIGTFHWACGALLRRYGHHAGIRRDFRLISGAEARSLLGNVVGKLGPGERLADIARALSGVKNGSGVQEEAARLRMAPEQLVLLRRRYDAGLAMIRALDLDDLLAVTARLLEENPDVRDLCRRAHDEILVDEYQDTNPVQRRILQLLLPSTQSLVAVGDEDQAIYSWRYADPRSVLRFSDDFPGAETITLAETYRSTKRILRAARAVVVHNSDRLEKDLQTVHDAGTLPVLYVAADETEEADWIALEAKALCERENVQWNQIGVLLRVNAQSRPLEDALLRHGIPYQFMSGSRFYDRNEIRQVTAYLRLALDESDDEAVVTLLNALPGIGPRRVERIRALSAERGILLLQTLGLDDLRSIPGSTRAQIAHMGERIEVVRALRGGRLEKVVDGAIQAVRPSLNSLSQLEVEAIEENLAEFQGMVRDFARRRGTLRTLLDRISLASTVESTADGVQLMSVHSSKGLEFAIVFVPGLEEGLLPHRRSLATNASVEEERRLLYVAMTRAREHVRLSYAHLRSFGSQTTGGERSRFIREMGPDHVMLRMSTRAAARPRLPSARIGDRVDHPRWRRGTVTAVVGEGRDTFVTILFDDGRSRRVQLCHAPLRQIGGQVVDAFTV